MSDAYRRSLNEVPATARWLGRALGVPPSLVRAADPDPIAPQRRTDP